MTEGTFQFIPHHRRAEYEAKGWTVSDDLSDTHNGRHSVLMKAPDAEPASAGIDLEGGAR